GSKNRARRPSAGPSRSRRRIGGAACPWPRPGCGGDTSPPWRGVCRRARRPGREGGRCGAGGPSRFASARRPAGGRPSGRVLAAPGGPPRLGTGGGGGGGGGGGRQRSARQQPGASQGGQQQNQSEEPPEANQRWGSAGDHRDDGGRRAPGNASTRRDEQRRSP